MAYRYKSIVFGFISSPFILNHVIKFHINQFPKDECSEILLNNVYVDNIFYTGSEPSALHALYKQSLSRMAEGGFQLRSWASNCAGLMSQFQEDGCATMHTSDCERVLGYRYFPLTDEFALTDFVSPEDSILSKRTVLSYVSKIFDPWVFQFR